MSTDTETYEFQPKVYVNIQPFDIVTDVLSIKTIS